VVTVFMHAVTDAQLLEANRIRVNRTTGAGGTARTTADIDVDSARTTGISTIAGLLGAIPFTSLRGARGDVGLSLRGARREGVVVTLDGMPLNDPATGTADLSDIPLALLGSANVSLGADPVGAGSGASGGVLALHSVARRVLSAGAGSFGAHSLDGAYQGGAGGAMLAGSASYRAAANDFSFVNDAGAANPGSPVRERRVNNDERRGAVTLAGSNERMHGLLLLSGSERGMVGPANVRTYDGDRARTLRALVRAQSSVGAASISVGGRVLSLMYRDPTRPQLDSRAETYAGDVDGSGVWRAVAWRLGVGADRIAATGNIHQSRARAFVAASRNGRVGSTTFELGARVDAAGTLGALPSFSAELRRDVVRSEQRALFVAARVAQAVRVPTLYDLYFSSPQRLFVRTLRPERVLLDAELNGGGTLRTTLGVVDAQVAVVARTVHDAIVWFPGNFGFSPQNVGVERMQGIEARAALRPRWGALSGWVTAYDTDLRVEQLHIPTPYVASVAGGAQLVAVIRRFTASANLRATGARPYTAGPRNADFELPAVALLGGALSTPFSMMGAHALASLSLENAAGASWQQVRGFPSPGRTWAFTLTLSPPTSR
jgi:outer membrane cobalamin receptor